MLVIVDTNILLSALRDASSPPSRIVDAWLAGRFRLATSTEQIDEFKRAARYPKLARSLPRGGVGRMVNGLRSAQVLLKNLPDAMNSPDPGDAYLIAMAAASDADYLVTGDKALLSMRRIGVTRVISARRFSSTVLRRGQSDS